MSGHSKWHNIQATKTKNDAARGKVFTKIGRELSVAVKLGGPDPTTNPRLRDCISKARANNMTNDSIDRAIKKASGELSAVNYEDITYEGYGIGGSAVIVECLTDNRNRSAGDVRASFDKYGGSMGVTNSVSFMFNRVGTIVTEKSIGEDEAFMIALDAGATDFEAEGENYFVSCEPTKIDVVKNALDGAGIKIVSSEVGYEPTTTVKLTADQLISFNKMIDKLEDLDDVQNVYHNVEMED